MIVVQIAFQRSRLGNTIRTILSTVQNPSRQCLLVRLVLLLGYSGAFARTSASKLEAQSALQENIVLPALEKLEQKSSRIPPHLPTQHQHAAQMVHGLLQKMCRRDQSRSLQNAPLTSRFLRKRTR